MLIRYVFILLVFLLPNMAWAQIDENDPFSSKSAGAALNAARKSAWSLSDPNFKFERVTPKGKNGGWDTDTLNGAPRPITIISGGVEISPDAPTSAKKTLKKKQKSGTGTHIKTNPNFMKWKRAQIRQAQENARIREEKKKIERMANRVKQAADYNANMSSYRAQNASRISEKIEQLKQVSATDYANVPQGTAGPKTNSLNNQEMADLLKEDDEPTGSITVEFVDANTERENHRDVTIGGENKIIDLFDDGGYDQNEYNLWEQALSSDKPTVLKDNTGMQKVIQQYEATLLIKKGDLDLDSFNITTLPDMGCVALIGDSILLLDNDSLPFLQWSVESNVSQVIACGGKTIGKRDNQIVEIKDDGLELICELDDEYFDIYPETDSTFIVSAGVIDLFIVIRINVNTKTYDELLRTMTAIRKVVSNRKVTLTLLDNRIIDISESPKLFYLSDTDINDICMCQEGLLVATDHKVFLLISPLETYVFTDEGASKLWCDGTDIYLINPKGDLIRYSKIQ